MQSYQCFQCIGHTGFKDLSSAVTNTPSLLPSMGKTGLGAIVCKTAHACFHSRKRVHTRLCSKNRTQRLTGRNRGVSDGAAISTLDTYCTFTNIPGSGIRTANFAALGAWSWVLPKNAESSPRDSDALTRVAVPRRRGPAGLRDLFRFCRSCGLYALFQILLSVLQTLQLVPFLCKLRLSSFLFGSEFNGFRSKQAGFFAIILENV